jgi:hypothetical protein
VRVVPNLVFRQHTGDRFAPTMVVVQTVARGGAMG